VAQAGQAPAGVPERQEELKEQKNGWHPAMPAIFCQSMTFAFCKATKISGMSTN
jgi:hypothetical protein